MVTTWCRGRRGLASGAHPEGSSAHLGCYWLARDSEFPSPLFNYTWVTAIICTDETDALKVSPHLQYYDWNAEEWYDLFDLTHVAESDDDMVASYGALTISSAPPRYDLQTHPIVYRHS